MFGRRALLVATVAALTMGCVADTSGFALGGRGWTGRPDVQPVPAAVAPPARVAPSATPGNGERRPPPARPSMPGPRGPVEVPILYYHRIKAPPSDYGKWSAAAKRQFITYDVIPAAFEAQLDWLQANGYTTILPRDLANYWDHGLPLPERPVIITFDDGSRSWVTTVLRMLRAHGMVAEFYLTLDAIEHGNLTWAQVRRLAKFGNGIGAHDVNHVQLTAFRNGRAPESRATMWAEVSEARRIIGLNVGLFPDSMAYVGGGYDATLQQVVADAGYTTARGIVRGTAQRPGQRLALRVTRIGSHDDVIDLVAGTLVPGLPKFTARMGGTVVEPEDPAVDAGDGSLD